MKKTPINNSKHLFLNITNNPSDLVFQPTNHRSLKKQNQISQEKNALSKDLRLAVHLLLRTQRSKSDIRNLTVK